MGRLWLRWRTEAGRARLSQPSSGLSLSLPVLKLAWPWYPLRDSLSSHCRSPATNPQSCCWDTRRPSGCSHCALQGPGQKPCPHFPGLGCIHYSAHGSWALGPSPSGVSALPSAGTMSPARSSLLVETLTSKTHSWVPHLTQPWPIVSTRDR